MSPEQYRIERERRGTQASVAALLRVDPQTISRRERGEIPITHEAGLALLSLPKTIVAKHADFSQCPPHVEEEVDRLNRGEGGPAS